ncbi:hypothetical protein KZZ52_00200 [Dactylosporangium sp. AC04546]|uniref:hypothetical protein n=1 Tax=Dactylosporangium sp. AC04546 TaxID=2862460 RepID=UPI002E7ABF44|nr:hypothetical protein [Dactylosporangium sp. AC04546]WVK83918.1 hypothetical protein KZZ52_00200 [Dactylosporangium sp. AC04546]
MAWLAATSTVIGALCADRLAAGGAPVPANPGSAAGLALTIAWRVVTALSAAVGSLIIVPLVAIPARAPRPDNAAPYFAAGGYAVAGIIVGLIIAIAALTARAIAANVIATSAWVWTLAVVAVADVVRVDGETATAAQLGTWQFADGTWIRGTVNLPGALLMLAAALVIGGLAAWPAGRRGDNRVGVAVAGGAGPVLVALAYLLAAPALGTERDQHLSAFYIAPYALIAGLAGSVLVAAIGPRGSRAQARATRKAAAANRDARNAAEISDWTSALAEADAAEARRREDAGEELGDDPWVSPKNDKGKKEPVTVGAAELDSATDLESDAYAPSRAYGKSSEKSGRTYTSESANRAYAEDTVTEDEAPTVPTPATSSSGHKPPAPLWPEQTTDSAPAKPPAGRPKRGRGRQSE